MTFSDDSEVVSRTGMKKDGVLTALNRKEKEKEKEKEGRKGMSEPWEWSKKRKHIYKELGFKIKDWVGLDHGSKISIGRVTMIMIRDEINPSEVKVCQKKDGGLRIRFKRRKGMGEVSFLKKRALKNLRICMKVLGETEKARQKRIKEGIYHWYDPEWEELIHSDRINIGILKAQRTSKRGGRWGRPSLQEQTDAEDRLWWGCSERPKPRKKKKKRIKKVKRGRLHWTEEEKPERPKRSPSRSQGKKPRMLTEADIGFRAEIDAIEKGTGERIRGRDLVRLGRKYNIKV